MVDRSLSYININLARILVCACTSILSVFSTLAIAHEQSSTHTGTNKYDNLATLTTRALDNSSFIFRVVNLQPGDSLNVRREPTVNSEVIGTLPLDSKPLEIISLNGPETWGQINFQGETGWVSMAYLELVRVKTLGDSAVPFPLQCNGTEPFWSYLISELKRASFSDIHDPQYKPLTIRSLITPANSAEQSVAVISEGSSLTTTAFIKPYYCNNGSSDQIYRWKIDLLLNSNESIDKPVWLTGCCSLQSAN